MAILRTCQRIHDKEKDFQCQKCNSAPVFKQTLKGHVKAVYNKEKDFNDESVFIMHLQTVLLRWIL